MTRKHPGQDQQRTGVRKLINKWVLSSASVAAVFACLVLVPAASATSLSAWPTFECYQGGYLRADKISVNEDGRTTWWFPEVFIYNGQTWVLDAVPNSSNTFQDTGFGELADSQFDFTVPRGRYYEVKDIMISSGDAGNQYAWANAMVGAAGTHMCYMS